MAVDAPFVGLSPFDARYRDYFFGRRKDAAIVAANILSDRVTVVFGRSGVGKTSLMQAGVPPALAEFEPTTFLCLRAWQDDPYGALSALLLSAAGEAGLAPAADARAAAIASDIVAHTRQPLVLVLDQFEEFFQGTNAPSRDAFEVDLSLMVSDLARDIHVAVSIRDDALYRLDALKGRIPEIMSRTIEVEGLSLEAASEAVRGPVARYNEEHGTTYRVDDALVAELLREVVSRPRYRRLGDAEGTAAKPTVEAPFLQLALKVLWAAMLRQNKTVLSLSLLTELGGAEAIVARHLASVIRSVKSEEEPLAVILDRLVTPEGHKIALSPDDLVSIVAEETDRPADAVRPRVTALLGRLEAGDDRILRQTEGGRFELFHDILAEPVVEWVRAYGQRRRDRARRRRVLLGGGAMLLVLLALATLFVLQGQRREAIAREHAAAALAELDQGNARGAVLAAVKALDLMPETAEAHVAGSIQEALWGGLSRLRSSRIFAIATGGGCLATSSGRPAPAVADGDPRSHDEWVYGVDFSPDGRRVATAGGDGLARIWDVETARCLCQLEGHGAAVRSIAFRPRDPAIPDGLVIPMDRTVVATASLDGTARLWDAGACREIGPLSDDGSGRAHREGVRAIAFSRDGRRVVTGSYDNSARVWDAATRRSIAVLPAEPDPDKPRELRLGHIADVFSVAFSPIDDDIVATGSYDTTARIWDISDPSAVTSRGLIGHLKEVYSVAFSPDGTELATASTDDSVRIWSVASGQMIRGPLNAHKFDIWRAVYGRNVSFQFKDQPLLVTGGWDRTVRIWTANTFQELAELVGHDDPVRDVAISRDGRYVASGSSDRTARLWDLRRINGVESLHHHPQRVTAIAPSPTEGDLFATGSIDGVVRLFRRYDSCPQLRLTDGFLLPVDGPAAAAPSPERIVDGSSGTCRELPFAKEDYNSGAVERVLIDPSGRMLFAAYECGRVVAWDLPSGQRRWMREPEYGGGSCVPPKDDPRRPTKRARALDLAFDPATGQLLVVAQQRAPVRGKILRLDPATGKSLGEDIDTGDGSFAVAAVAVTTDGTRLAVAETDLARYRKGRVRVFDLGPGGAAREPLTLDIADLRPVTRLVFADDGRTLAGASDRLAVVWHLPAGGAPDEPSRSVLSGHDGTITELAFDPAGRFLYTTSSDETVRVWSLATEETIHTISPLYGTIQAIALADKGSRIIVGGDDATAAVIENLADVGPARAWACAGIDDRRALNDREAARILGRIGAVDIDWLSFLPIVTRGDLTAPIACPPDSL